MAAPKNLADRFDEWAVTGPAKGSFYRGLEGKPYMEHMDKTIKNPFTGEDLNIGKALVYADRYGFNYATQGLKEFSNAVGKAMHNSGMNREMFEKMRALANKNIQMSNVPVVKNDIGKIPKAMNTKPAPIAKKKTIFDDDFDDMPPPPLGSGSFGHILNKKV